MRSVVVVFPASMWAMMPIFRYRSSGVSRPMPFPFAAVECGSVAELIFHQRKSGATEPGDFPVVSLRARPGRAHDGGPLQVLRSFGHRIDALTGGSEVTHRVLVPWDRRSHDPMSAR